MNKNTSPEYREQENIQNTDWNIPKYWKVFGQQKIPEMFVNYNLTHLAHFHEIILHFFHRTCCCKEFIVIFIDKLLHFGIKPSNLKNY